MARDVFVKKAGWICGATFIVATAVLFFVTQRDQSPAVHASDLIIIANLPQTVSIEAEARSGKDIYVLDKHTDDARQIFSAPAAAPHPDSLTLRIQDKAANRLYDISYDRRIALQGFEPRSKLSVTTPEKSIYSDMPMDWNGRTAFATPRTPLTTLAFSQHGVDYTISLAALNGGPS